VLFSAKLGIITRKTVQDEQPTVWSDIMTSVQNIYDPSDPLKILIVEDDKEWREIMAESLTSGDFMVFQEVDYNSAKKALQSRKKQYRGLALILLDLGLPGGNGMDLLKMVKGRWEQDRTKVIIVTGQGWTKDYEEARRYPQFHDFIPKGNPDREFEDTLIEMVYEAIRAREIAKRE
jgi:DNA-binding NtrC family response regulator